MTHPTTIDAPAGLPFLDVTREFDAAPELVLRAWTDPDLVVQWLGPRRLTMRVDEWDARDGGSWAYTHIEPNGAEHKFRGLFHTVRPGLLVQTFEYLGVPDDVCLETLTFDGTAERTTVRQHAVFSSVESRDGAVASGMESGVRESMERLDDLVAAVLAS